MKKYFLIAACFLCLHQSGFSQSFFSFGTDFGVQRNFRKTQEFLSFGPTFNAIFHLSPKNAVYTWFGFNTNGRFKNHNLVATAKQPTTVPQQLSFTNKSKMRLKEFSIGWKNYLKGRPDIKKGWSLYTNAGLGLMFGTVINNFSVSSDTTLYNYPVYPGGANFKRLTLDLGLGIDFHLAADMYFYSEFRTLVPTSSYPSKHLLENNDAPLIGMLCAGIRILF